MSDPPPGVLEMRRVTRHGGTGAAAVWDYAGEMTLLRRFWDAAVSLDPSAADLDEGRCMPSLRRPLELGVAPSGAYAASLATEQRMVLKQELRNRLGAGDDPFRLTARAWIATGLVA